MALAPGSRYNESTESDDTRSEITLLIQAVSKQVVSRDFVLKVNKKSKGSRAWDQFHLVWDPSKKEEVYGIACCAVCKSCLLYKMEFSMSVCTTFKQKTSACGSQVDHIQITQWVKWVNRCDPLSTLVPTINLDSFYQT